MSKINRIIFLFLVLLSIQNTKSFAYNDELKWADNWFKAWELVSKDLLKLSRQATPEMVFYDNTYVYTNSSKSAPEGTILNGPKFFGENIVWKKQAHSGKIILPDGNTLPLGLYSFAGNMEAGKAFFVMAAPSFWLEAGVKSDDVPLEKLITSVFLHEFAHVSQFKGIATKVDEIEKQYTFKDPELTDDIIQDIFKSNKAYVDAFTNEVEMFYVAASDTNYKKNGNQALALLYKRHQDYFNGDKIIYKDLDRIFLTMEGLGQFVAYQWLKNPKGGMESTESALKAMRRNKKFWSQDQGLALFLLLEKTGFKNWNQVFFSSDKQDIVTLLNKILKG